MDGASNYFGNLVNLLECSVGDCLFVIQSVIEMDI